MGLIRQSRTWPFPGFSSSILQNPQKSNKNRVGGSQGAKNGPREASRGSKKPEATHQGPLPVSLLRDAKGLYPRRRFVRNRPAPPKTSITIVAGSGAIAFPITIWNVLPGPITLSH